MRSQPPAASASRCARARTLRAGVHEGDSAEVENRLCRAVLVNLESLAQCVGVVGVEFAGQGQDADPIGTGLGDRQWGGLLGWVVIVCHGPTVILVVPGQGLRGEGLSRSTILRVIASGRVRPRVTPRLEVSWWRQGDTRGRTMNRSSEGSDSSWGLPSVMEASLALDGDGSRIAQARHLAAVFLAGVRDIRGVPVVVSGRPTLRCTGGRSCPRP